jgi:hypothetical protein
MQHYMIGEILTRLADNMVLFVWLFAQHLIEFEDNNKPWQLLDVIMMSYLSSFFILELGSISHVCLKVQSYTVQCGRSLTYVLFSVQLCILFIFDLAKCQRNKNSYRYVNRFSRLNSINLK